MKTLDEDDCKVPNNYRHPQNNFTDKKSNSAATKKKRKRKGKKNKNKRVKVKNEFQGEDVHQDISFDILEGETLEC